MNKDAEKTFSAYRMTDYKIETKVLIRRSLKSDSRLDKLKHKIGNWLIEKLKYHKILIDSTFSQDVTARDELKSKDVVDLVQNLIDLEKHKFNGNLTVLIGHDYMKELRIALSRSRHMGFYRGIERTYEFFSGINGQDFYDAIYYDGVSIICVPNMDGICAIDSHLLNRVSVDNVQFSSLEFKDAVVRALNELKDRRWIEW